MKKMFLAGASVLVLSTITPAFTDDTDKVVNATGNLFIDTINKQGIFEWISGGIGYTDKTLNWDITAFSNLSETKDTVTYLQTSYNRQKSVNRLNLGLGYRKLIDTTTAPLIVGVNAFFDSKDGTKNILAFKSSENFQRFSVGAELKTARFDMAANLYRRIGNNIIDDKKVLQGWDITAKGNIPNYEQVSVGVNTYRFDGVGDTVVKGNKLIAEFTPNAVVTVRGEYDKPNGESAQTDISVDFKLAFGKSIQDQLQSALKSTPISGTDTVWHKRYDKVERHYEIRTADAENTPALGDTLSAADKTANKISAGDGTTEGSAYALQNGEQYDVADFLGDIPDTLKTTGGAIDPNKVTVKVEQVAGDDGAEGTDYEFYASDGTTTVPLAEVTADSQFKDIAGGKVATLKLTYSADGFEDRVVYVSAAAISQIGSVLSDSDKTNNDIKGGDGSSQATAYTLTNAQTYDLKTFIGTLPTGITPTVKAERVSGTSGTDFQFKNGGTNVAVGSATYTSTLEDKAGAGAAVIKLTYSAADFNDRIVYVKTDTAFTGSLTMTNLVVPYGSGNVTVSTAQILGKLSVSGGQTQKSDWSLKSLADTDNSDKLAVNGKTLVISGAIPSGTTVTAVFEHTDSEYADQSKTFELSTGAGTLGDAPTGLSGKWGKTFTVDYKLKASDTVGDVTVSFDPSADFTFTILPNSDGGKGGKDATTAGIVSGDLSGAIDDKTGAIDGTKLNKSGKVLVKIERRAKGGLPALTVYENITVNKQELGAGKDVTTIPTISLNSGDNKWKTSTATKFDLKYTNLPGGLAANAFTWAVANKAGAAPSGTVRIDNDGKISGATSAGTVVITLTAKGDKYSGSLTLADFAIAKQTATDTLSMADLVISYVSGDGNKVVSTAEILGQLSVSSTGTAQTQKSEWTLVSVADTDNNGDLAVTGSGKTLTISDEIKTKTTVTATLSHPAYENKTATFELSTEPSKISTGGRTGSGKWGKSYTTNYKLRTSVGSVTFTNADYTFSIVPTGDDGSGKTPTTSGIVASGQNAISNIRTGAIDASKLTKSGTLLIKIVRAAKGTGAARVDAVTEYQNFTVSKQDGTDHSGFSISAGTIRWNASSQTVSYTENASKPTGISNSPTYALIASGTTAGATTGGNAITVASSDGKIANTTQRGVVKVRVTYAANDKYETITRDVSVPVSKQVGTGALTMGNLVIPYASGTKAVSTATITGKLGVPSAGGLGATSDWTLKSLADTDSHSNLAETDSGKTLTISGAITTSTTVTATFQSDKYTDKSAAFELSTGAGEMTDTSATRTGLRGKWGVGFTTAADYKLKLSDTVGDTTVTFTKGDTTNAGDYTFTIVPTSDGGKGGKDATTAGIAQAGAINANTGAIDGSKLNKSGKVLVKIVRAAKGGLPALTDYENITVDRQVLGTDVTTIPTISLNSGDNKWKTGNTKFDLKYTNLPGGLSASAFGWGIKSTTASGLLEIDANGKISKATSAGTVSITMTASASNNDKYSGSFDLAAFTIAKQTTSDTLSMADLVIFYADGDGNKVVTTAEILGQLSVSSTGTAQTQKSEWTLVSVANTDNNGDLAVSGGGKTLTISDEIKTKTTVTAVLSHPAYENKTATFELSTERSKISNGPRTGSGKWGKSYTADYNLRPAVNGVTFVQSDYTFSIVTGAVPSDAPSGTKATTTGILDTSKTAINTNTGAINAAALTKSGTLLIKIVRAKRGSVDTVTEYQNFTVSKQDSSDHSGFSVSAGAIAWNANSQTVSYTENASKPAGIGTATYALVTSGTTAGATTGGDAITVASSDGKIGKTTKGGVVKVKITYAANDKYETITRDVDVTINKQAGTGALSMGNFVIPYGGSGDTKVSTATITGKLTVPNSLGAKSEWTLKSLADTDSHSNLAETDSGKTLTISGAIPTSTTVTATFESDKYTDKTATFELSTGAGAMSTGDTRTGLSGKWGIGFSTAADYKLKLTDSVGDTTVTFTKGATTTPGDYTFTILPTSDGGKGGKDATTANIVTGALTGAINANTGAIVANKLTKSGTLLVKIVRKAKGGLPELIDYENITVSKQVLGTDVTTIPTISPFLDDFKWKTNPATTFGMAYINLPGGQSANAFDWSVAKKASNAPSGNIQINSLGQIFGATSGGTVVITLTAKGDKYSGTMTLADFAIAKQTGTDSLSMADLVIFYADGDGNKVVTTAEILGQLSVSSTGTAQTQKSEWTLVSVADSDNNGDLAVTGGGKTLTISDEIKTKTTVTAVLSHPAYENKTATFELSTEPSKISKGPRTGSGKWGKAYTADYNLRPAVNGVTFLQSDYTFSIITGAVPNDAPSGTKATTAGIVANGQTAITARTGAIDGTKLTKSGTLLIKIFRAKRGSVDTVTEYQNFTVSKQDSSDHTGFSVSAGAIAWATASTAVTYTRTNAPAGIGTATYALTASGTTAGPTTGASAITVASSDGKIGKTTKGGVVKVRVTYPANDKYETITRNVDVTINKQVGTGALSMDDLVIPYGGSGDKVVNTATIAGKLGVPSAGGLGATSDWTLKSLADTDSAGNTKFVIVNNKAITIKGAIPTSTTVTATFASDKYTDKTATFELSTGAGTMSTGDTRTGVSGKWGIGFSVAADYKLKLSDTVGDTSVTFIKGATSTPGDYTFTIVTGNVPSDAPSGTKVSSTGILDTSKTAINANTGAINGMALTKSGDLLVKIVRKAKGGLPELIDYENITVTKQDSSDHSGFTVSAGGIPWATASRTVTYTPTNLPTGIGTATYALTASGTDAGPTTGGNAITVASSDGKIGKTAQSGVVKVKITYAANDKYETITRDVDVTINKQTVHANTLSVANLVVTYVSGTETVRAADILGQLTATGSSRSDWTVKSLTNTDNHASVGFPVSGGLGLVISGAINTPTTITVVFESTKYENVTKTFKLSTRPTQLIDGTPAGKGKWGKSYTVDYALNLTDNGVTFTTGASGDYTFSVVTGAVPNDAPSGTKATTAGIVNGQAIAANTGIINATKLTKSGTLLIKIVRDPKGGLPETTGYVNLTVGKQDLASDITKPTVSSTDSKWKTSGAKIPLAFAGLPNGTGFGDYSWTVAGKAGNDKPDEISAGLSVAADGLTGATSGGKVIITMQAKSDDSKYTGQVNLADFTITKQDLASDITKPTVSSTDSTWKTSGAKIPLAFAGLPSGTAFGDYSWTVAGKTGNDKPDEISAGLSVASDGLTGATSGGKAVITMRAKSDDSKYSGQVDLADFTITKQVLGTDVTTPPAVAKATNEDGKWKSDTSAKIKLNYTLPGGTSTSDYSWKVDKKSGAEPDGTLAIDGNGHISGAKSGGTAEITITAKSTNKKYSGNMRTADFTIAKQTETGTLKLADIIVSYRPGVSKDKTIRVNDILSKLSIVSGSSSTGDWTLKSLRNTGGNANLVINNDNTITVKGAITTSTTITATFESTKYEQKTADVEVSTQPTQLSSSARLGSGTWGKTYATHYRFIFLDNGVSFTTGSITVPGDYTFEILPHTVSVSGFTSTTAGIAQAGAIDQHNGKIDATKLTRGGILLIKITRKAKGGLAQLIEYQNFTVDKQVLGTDVTTPPAVTKASGEDGIWKNNMATKINLDYTLPGNTTPPHYTWTVQGKSGNVPSGTLTIDQTSGDISGATSAGTIEMTITAKSNNPQYSGSIRTADFSINKQKATGTLSMADLIVPYVSGSGDKTIGAASIQGTLSVTGGSSKKDDWTLKSLANTDGNTKLVINNDNSITIKDAFTTSTTITATFESTKYEDETATIKISTQPTRISSATRSGSGAWGKSYTTDYKLNLNDNGVSFTTGTNTIPSDFTFEILANTISVPGFAPTTAGIVNGALTGAINKDTGQIDATKLTRGGVLLVKITRAAKGSLPKLIEHENFKIDKQNLADYTPKPTVSSTDNKWKDRGGKIPLTFAGFPTNTNYEDYTWTAAGTASDAPDTISTGLSVASDGISGAESSGTVVITMTAKNSNIKYSGKLDLANFSIAKHTISMPTIATSLTSGNLHVTTGTGSSRDPFLTKSSNIYTIKDMVSGVSPILVTTSSVKVTAHWTMATDASGTLGGADLTLNTLQPEPPINNNKTGFTVTKVFRPAPNNRTIVDHSKFLGLKSFTMYLRFAFSNPDTKKYIFTPTLIDVYLKSEDCAPFCDL